MKRLYGLLALALALFIVFELPSFSKIGSAEIYQNKASHINTSQDVLDGTQTLISQINFNRRNQVYTGEVYSSLWPWTTWNGWNADRGASMHNGIANCPSGTYAEGLSFRRFRNERGNVDTYKFSLKCGNGSLITRSREVGIGEGSEVGDPYPNAVNHTGEYWAQGIDCRINPIQPFTPMVGMEVERYRRGRGDHDTYRFRLACAQSGQQSPVMTQWVGTTRGNRVATYIITNFHNRIESLQYQYFRNNSGNKDGYQFRLKHTIQ